MPKKRDRMASEPSLPAPHWWKLLARATSKERKLTQKDLADLIGGSQAGVSDALSLGDRGRPASRYVRPISRALGIPSPSVTVTDNDESELIARLLAAARLLAGSNPQLLRAQAELLEQVAASQRDLDRETDD